MKKGIVNIHGNEVEQYIIENKKDLEIAFKTPQINILPSLKKVFLKLIESKKTVLVDINPNITSFHSWRTTEKDNFILINII